MDHTSDPTAARWPVDPDRLDLVQEFRHRIRGPHSPDLQKLIARLRWGPIAGRYVVLTLETGRRLLCEVYPLLKAGHTEEARVNGRALVARFDGEG